MKIPELQVGLDQIPPEGLELALNIAPESLAALVATDSEPPVVRSPLLGRLRLIRLDEERLALKGAFEVEVEIPCDRCLGEIRAVLTGEVNEILDLVAPGGATAEDRAEDRDESDGILEIRGGQVDLTPLLAEHFWLAWPFRFICRADCAGLCPRCGANLNDGQCRCPASGEK